MQGCIRHAGIHHLQSNGYSLLHHESQQSQKTSLLRPKKRWFRRLWSSQRWAILKQLPRYNFRFWLIFFAWHKIILHFCFIWKFMILTGGAVRDFYLVSNVRIVLHEFYKPSDFNTAVADKRKYYFAIRDVDVQVGNISNKFTLRKFYLICFPITT